MSNTLVQRPQRCTVMTFKNSGMMLVLSLLLSACALVPKNEVVYEYVEPVDYPTITAIGMAPINSQTGPDRNTKMLKAMKASRLEAYRELVEQVYGQRLKGQGKVADMVLGEETLKSQVDGVIRGAKVIRSYQVGENYATEMELNLKQVNLLIWKQNQIREAGRISY